MSLWKKIVDRVRPGTKSEAPPDETAPPSSSGAGERNEKREAATGGTSDTDVRLARLDTFGKTGGPDAREATGLFAELRMTSFEGAALALLAPRAATLPEDLRAAAAKAALDRGEPALAKRFLDGALGVNALLLAADIAEEENDAPGALALIERVLARAIDQPGARERHTRLAAQLGRKPVAATPAAAEGTVLSASVQSPYVLRREIARGGAAAVYEAEDRDLGRRIALKVYHDATNGRAQLLHEARVATELAQPGVVRVFDVDVRGGWLVLEYFERGSLREWLRERPEELARLEWLTMLARTLDEVHARGYVHLDVKPANVLLRNAREAVLSDFGSARKIAEASPAGSLGYVAPERLAGAHATIADDVYGFGRIVQDVLASAAAENMEAKEREDLALFAQRCVGPANARPALRDFRAGPRRAAD